MTFRGIIKVNKFLKNLIDRTPTPKKQNNQIEIWKPNIRLAYEISPINSKNWVPSNIKKSNK